MNPAAPTASAPKRSRLGRLVRFGLIALAALAVLTAAFYLEENSRGKSAWAASKKALESQQEVLDWTAYIPPAVPDDQNFFKAPKMQDWFIGNGSNELTSLLALASLPEWKRQQTNTNNPTLIAEWRLRSDDAGPVATNHEDSPPLQYEALKFDNMSLSNALWQLAVKAHLKIQIDPHIDSLSASTVTGGWSNVTARAVMLALVCNHDLHWVENPDTGVALIKMADLNAQPSALDPVNIILGMLRKAVAPSDEAVEGFALGANAFLQLGPMRLSVSADGIPARAQMMRLFVGGEALRVEPAGDALRVSLAQAPIAAADYLKWSDQFAPQFQIIREAVKRPASRIDGDYQNYNQMPALDFISAEAAARVFTDRARCFLILNQPEQALAELTWYHDFLGCLARPGGKPIALASAAEIMTFHALYAETVAAGLGSRLWSEPELTALQDQLGHIDLVSLAWNAMESDRAWRCHYLEMTPRPELAQALQLGGPSSTFAEKMKNYKYLVLQFMPEGWLYQNLARTARLRQGDIDAVDRALGVIHPHQVENARQQAVAAFAKASPFSMLAKLAAPPLDPTLTATARIQTLVNETLVVCALERFRLAHGLYPDKLDVLVPDSIAALPLDPINGDPLQYRHIQGGRFSLYSIGWDEKDNNGTPIDAQGNGDWIWGGR